MIKLRSIELVEINLPLVHFFETSFGRTYERRIILVRVEDEDGAEGWGEVTCGETPGYSNGIYAYFDYFSKPKHRSRLQRWWANRWAKRRAS